MMARRVVGLVRIVGNVRGFIGGTGVGGIPAVRALGGLTVGFGTDQQGFLGLGNIGSITYGGDGNNVSDERWMVMQAALPFQAFRTDFWRARP